MKVFISHADTDAPLARKVALSLQQAGMDVWYAENEIFPGDNWAAKIADGLEDSNAMVVLMTEHAVHSNMVRWSINFALGSLNFAHRLITVFVGDPSMLPEAEIPWILRQLKTINLPANGHVDEGITQITQALQAAA
ncbi:MAG: toll/interleukin-1 receptor domain-containing protein [Blastocatellia bacterium]